MMTEQLKEGKAGFMKLLSSPSYIAEANYYVGYIAYKQKDYATAEVYLTKASQEQSYEGEASYSLLDINFKNGKFGFDTNSDVYKHEIQNNIYMQQLHEIIFSKQFFNYFYRNLYFQKNLLRQMP